MCGLAEGCTSTDGWCGLVWCGGAAARPAGGSLTGLTVPRTLHIPHTPHSTTTTPHNISHNIAQQQTQRCSIAAQHQTTCHINSSQHRTSAVSSSQRTTADATAEYHTTSNNSNHNTGQETPCSMLHHKQQDRQTRAGTKQSRAPTPQQPGPSTAAAAVNSYMVQLPHLLLLPPSPATSHRARWTRQLLCAV